MKIIVSANHTTRRAVIKHYSPSLFARCLFMHAQAGWILINCGLTTNTEHNVCTSLQATVVSWPFGRNLCTCVLFFPLPKLFQPSLLFQFISHCRSLLFCALLSGCSSSPSWLLFVCPVVTGRFSLDLVHTSARMGLLNSQAFISVLCRVRSTRATL